MGLDQLETDVADEWRRDEKEGNPVLVVGDTEFRCSDFSLVTAESDQFQREANRLMAAGFGLNHLPSCRTYEKPRFVPAVKDVNGHGLVQISPVPQEVSSRDRVAQAGELLRVAFSLIPQELVDLDCLAVVVKGQVHQFAPQTVGLEVVLVHHGLEGSGGECGLHAAPDLNQRLQDSVGNGLGDNPDMGALRPRGYVPVAGFLPVPRDFVPEHFRLART